MSHPIRQLAALVLAILLGEACIMLGLPLLPEFPSTVVAIIDSVVLIAVVFPALFYFAYRPMLRQLKQREQAQRALIAQREQLRSLASELFGAEESARRQFGEGLHESIAQLLSVLRIKLAAATANASSAGSREMQEFLDEAIRETNRLIYDLTHPELYEIGLHAAVDRLAERMTEQYGLSVHIVERGGRPVLPIEVRVAAYHVVQGLLCNVGEHASAKRVTVTVEVNAERLRLKIEDDGVGFDAADVSTSQNGKLGLIKIRERLRLLGGQLQIDSTPGRGTRATATMPAAIGSSASDTGGPLSNVERGGLDAENTHAGEPAAP